MSTYYAKHNAGGGGVGSFADPFTFQELLDNTDAGDLGLVCNTGIYTPAATIDVDNVSAATTTNPAIIRGANADGSDDGTVATISGSGLGANTDLLYINGANQSVFFEGLRFTAATQDNISISANINYGNIKFERCKIDGATRYGIYDQESATFALNLINVEIDSNGNTGVKISASSRMTPYLLSCNIHDNAGTGIEVGGAYSLRTAIIIGCKIYDNSSDGINIATNVQSLVIWNNVLFANDGDGIDMPDNCYAMLIANNIIRSNGGYGINTNTGNINQFAFIRNNCSHNNTSGHIDINGGALPGSDHITSDPLFTSEINGSEDFSLQSESPCRNAGFGYTA